MTSVAPHTNPSPTTAVERPVWLPASVWPFEIRSLSVGEHTVAYTDHGTSPAAAPTLVFVHSGMWSFVFRDVISRLGTEFRCITLDFPGHGLSPEPDGWSLTLSEHSRILGDVIDELGLHDMVLVLHDLGGVVGAGAAAERADRISGLVLANTFLWRPDRRSLRTMLRIVSSRPLTAVDRLTGFIPRLTTGKAGIGRHLDRASKRAFLAGMRQPRQTMRFHHLMRDALRGDELYRRVEAATATSLAGLPVLTIFGERNDPFGFQERHRATFADYEGLVVTAGNHFPMMDDPELFAETVTAWLRR
ncbi:MAG: alpha/beta fold hydrolase [Acidimicrobiia bacterium]|nr:alpha/beta fold hydrolase [Acidimicrobiia bacterium]